MVMKLSDDIQQTQINSPRDEMFPCVLKKTGARRQIKMGPTMRLSQLNSASVRSYDSNRIRRATTGHHPQANTDAKGFPLADEL